MFRLLLVAGLSLLVLVLFREPLSAYQDAESGREELAAPVGLLALDPERVAALPPLQKDLHEVLVRERDVLETLEAQLLGLKDPRRVIEVQRQIQSTKQETERELLGVQAHHARLAGDEAMARRLEELVEALVRQGGGSDRKPR